MSDSESVSSSASSIAAPTPAEMVKEIRQQLKAAADHLKQLAAATKGLKAPKKKAASSAPRKPSDGMLKWQAFQKFVWSQLKEDNPAAPFKEAMKTAGERWEKGEPISSKDKRRFTAWLEENPIPTAEEALVAAAEKKAAAEQEKEEKKAAREAEKARKAKEKAKTAKSKPKAKAAADSSDSESDSEAEAPKPKPKAKAKAAPAKKVAKAAAASSDSESEAEAPKPKPKAKAAPAKKAAKAAAAAAASSDSESEPEVKPKKGKAAAAASPKLSPSPSAAAPAPGPMATMEFQGKTYYINRKTRNLYADDDDITYVGRLSVDEKSIDFEIGERDPDVPAGAAAEAE